MPVDPARPVSRPEGRILSNGGCTALLARLGLAALSFGEIALTRGAGSACEAAGAPAWAVRDRESGAWFEPSLAAPDPASPGTASWSGERDGLSLLATGWIDANHASEIREFALHNGSDRPRVVDLTGCVEVVLQGPAAHAAHPVFSKLFVQTDWSNACGALLARRRPRGADQHFPWLLHALDGPGSLEFETDRARFAGRGRPAAFPAALASNDSLSGTVGNVLDPVLALRRVVTLAPGERATWRSILACGEGPEELLARLESMRRDFPASRAGADAAETARRFSAGLDAAAADEAQRFLLALARRAPGLRAGAPPAPQEAAGGAIECAWIARDAWPVVVDARSAAGAAAAAELERVQRYAASLGLPMSLLVLAPGERSSELPATVQVRDPSQLGEASLRVIGAHARAWIAAPSAWRLVPVEPATASSASAFAPRAEAARAGGEPLAHFNGIGGFAEGGAEYVILLQPDAGGRPILPPAPWTNVIANPSFGTLVSETGAGFTWSLNSREHRLTPWLNDPVLDPHSGGLYVRDEDDGRVWSPQPGPVPSGAGCEVRHRSGATAWKLEARGIAHRTTVCVPPDAPVLLSRLELTNRSGKSRRLRVTSFQRLVLGAVPGEAGVSTTCESALGAVFATQPLSGDAPRAVTWASASAPDGAAIRVGNDASAFLGAGRRLDQPESLAAGDPPRVAPRGDADPSAIVEVTFDLPPGATRVVTFLLGEEPDRAAAERRITQLRAPGAIDRTVEDATGSWAALSQRLRITTPEPALDAMVNHWLPYQNLSCRVWGRSAFYQSGGAFGFRDQLQDSAAFLWTRPELTRQQILLHAAHQFVEGDVLHWWHPPRSRGIRTRFADDLLWLPWIAASYVEATGDAALLEEVAPFLAAAALEPGEQERFLEPVDAGHGATVYEHAARAIDRSLVTGAHGLPLFGCGDWNDGMNRVGHDGRGESVWMAFFLHTVIGSFAPHAEARADHARAARWRAHQRALESALERAGWDGAWYRRGFYGDGTPLGSATSDECRIDALVQAWAVLSGAGPRDRAETAMRSAAEHLVSERDQLVRLLAPPFEHTPHDPGYIKGYVPGVRENGGQYTHAALWVVRAMAELGWRDRAARTLAMLSPISHTGDPESVARYKVEPYVVAADVYGAAPHVGRGGWTWYTGSAGWMYRVAIESVLGLRMEGGKVLRLVPCLPDEWPEASIDWTLPGSGTRLRLHYLNPSGSAAAVRSATLDGAPLELVDGVLRFPLPADGGEHVVEVRLGAVTEPRRGAPSA